MKYLLMICVFSYCHLGFSNCLDDRMEDEYTSKEVTGSDAFLTTVIEDGKLYLNIPKYLLDKPMLFRRYDDAIGDHNYMQVVWSMINERIVLKPQSIGSTAGTIIPFKKELPLMENILAIYPLEEKCKNEKGYCINITDLILSQNIEWAQRSQGYSGNPVPPISMILESKDYKNEVIIKTIRGVSVDNSKLSVPVYFGFRTLSEPMKSRRYDYRMGFGAEGKIHVQYGIDKYGKNTSIANISKWRLEKKYKYQKTSIPLEPITFILSPGIPKIWRPYIKAGIQEWLPAFEAAGFKDALIVKEVDSLDDWQRNKIGNNIVYWSQGKYFRENENKLFGGTANTVLDDRTGEILKSDIYLGSSRKNLEDRYFIRVAALDKRAQNFPFPNELVGKMFQCLAAHEAGHAFGLIDANFGESSYSVENIRSIDWIKSMGYTPSIMNYTRPNNIAQPEDSIPPSLLVQKVGPTDIYSIRWGYTEFPQGTSLEKEAQTLEAIVRLQDSIPWYRFNVSGYEIIGPSNTNEVVESNDPVKSTKLAIKNLERVMKLLPEACFNEKNNTRMVNLYNQIIELWFSHMKHVVSVVGGYDIHYKSINQPGKIYTPINKDLQKNAIDYLILNAFNAPNWLVNPDFNIQIRYSVNPDRVLQHQQFLIIELLRATRLKRFEFLESIEGYQGILQTYLQQLQKGLFSELKKANATVKPRNQELQLTYIDKMIWIIIQDRTNITVEEKTFDYTDYAKGLIMQQLISLRRDIEKVIKKNKESHSFGHWVLCLKKLKEL